MRKIIISLFVLLSSLCLASAQPRAIGIRGGWGAELSYQHTLGGENFVEVNAGLMSNATSVGATYNFMLAKHGIFNFYAGPGAQIGTLMHFGEYDERIFSTAIQGQIGVEAVIPDIPINFSLDWRPALWLGVTKFEWTGLALGIRYRF